MILTPERHHTSIPDTHACIHILTATNTHTNSLSLSNTHCHSVIHAQACAHTRTWFGGEGLWEHPRGDVRVRAQGAAPNVPQPPDGATQVELVSNGTSTGNSTSLRALRCAATAPAASGGAASTNKEGGRGNKGPTQR